MSLPLPDVLSSDDEASVPVSFGLMGNLGFLSNSALKRKKPRAGQQLPWNENNLNGLKLRDEAADLASPLNGMPPLSPLYREASNTNISDIARDRLANNNSRRPRAQSSTRISRTPVGLVSRSRLHRTALRATHSAGQATSGFSTPPSRLLQQPNHQLYASMDLSIQTTPQTSPKRRTLVAASLTPHGRIRSYSRPHEHNFSPSRRSRSSSRSSIKKAFQFEQRFVEEDDAGRARLGHIVGSNVTRLGRRKLGEQHSCFVQHEEYNAFSSMKNGSSFLWFDRASNVPKFARFKMEFNENLNAVHLSIRRKGDENATIINATNLISISRGQTSKIFNKKRLSAPRRLALISFTLTYDKRTKAQLQDSKSTVDTATIDVIAKDAMEFEIWTEGLETLISHYHNAYGCAEFMRQVVAKQCILISLPQGMKKQESYILDLVVSCPWTLVEMGYKSAATTDTKRSKKGGNLEERRGSFTVLSNIKRRFSSSSRSSRRNSTQSTTSVEDSEETSSSAVSAAASLQDKVPMRYFSNEGSFGDDGTSSEEDEAKFIQARVVRSLSRSSVDAPYVSTGSPLTRNSWMQESTTPTSALHTALVSSPSLSNSPMTSIIMTPALDPSEMRDMKIIPAPQNTPMSLSKIRRQQQLFMPLSNLLTVSPKKGKWVYGMFSLTRDQFYLTWVLPSDKKHKVEQRIKLSGIDRVVFGQTTKTFTKHKCPRELAEVSFTIIYDKNRQMDLIAPSTTAFEMWTEVLTKLSKQNSSTSMLHSVSIPQVEIPDMTRTTVINAFGAFDKDQFKLKSNEQQ